MNDIENENENGHSSGHTQDQQNRGNNDSYIGSNDGDDHDSNGGGQKENRK